VIILVNPRATRPRNRRFPLSLMAIGAALPEGTSWEIVDGNCPNSDPYGEIAALIEHTAGSRDPVRAVAMTVMPGPQLVSAVPLARRLKERFPSVPIVWGGYFPSLYPQPVLNAPYVDWIVRGQGEQTFVELAEVWAGRRDPRTVAGLGFRVDGTAHVGPERSWLGPDAFPPPPYAKIDVDAYLHPTFLGQRNAVYHASIGCPYSCNFCGVISAFGSKERWENPSRTAQNLSYLVERHGADAVHFYDNNFFLREDHAAELCSRLVPLGLSWWCEARIDAMLRFTDATWRTIQRSGLRMVFFGAESGSDERLKKMAKRLTTAQTVALAERTRAYGIIPEFSFVLGDPEDPEDDIHTTLAFIRRLKTVNPDAEIITYFYTPTPQRRGTYGQVDPLAGTPDTLEEWIEPAWVGWMTHEDPLVPWLPRRLKARVEDFELILHSRFPSIHDVKTRHWGKALAQLLARRRWDTERYDNPRLLRRVKHWAQLPNPDRQAYGHLRPTASSDA
jgi:anaerobic magnesium-protoporphyrin IX monomethyl ester cyclase